MKYRCTHKRTLLILYIIMFCIEGYTQNSISKNFDPIGLWSIKKITVDGKIINGMDSIIEFQSNGILLLRNFSNNSVSNVRTGQWKISIDSILSVGQIRYKIGFNKNQVILKSIVDKVLLQDQEMILEKSDVLASKLYTLTTSTYNLRGTWAEVCKINDTIYTPLGEVRYDIYPSSDSSGTVLMYKYRNHQYVDEQSMVMTKYKKSKQEKNKVDFFDILNTSAVFFSNSYQLSDGVLMIKNELNKTTTYIVKESDYTTLTFDQAYATYTKLRGVKDVPQKAETKITQPRNVLETLLSIIKSIPNPTDHDGREIRTKSCWTCKSTGKVDMYGNSGRGSICSDCNGEGCYWVYSDNGERMR